MNRRCLCGQKAVEGHYCRDCADYIKNYLCPRCGGSLIGDGYKLVRHCENADFPEDVEPDAGPIYCEPEY